MNTDRQVAVLIDFENVNIGAVEELLEKIPDIGRIIIKRAYADWSISKHQAKLIELGIELIHIVRSGGSGSGKNSSDIRLAIDVIDLLHQSPVATFIILSSDSDFVPLVSKLRSHGKTVYVAGRQATAPQKLVRSCDRYIFLDVHKQTKDKKATQKKEDDLLVKAVKAAINEEGNVLGSKLLQTIQRLDPSFDFHRLGYSTFSKYLESSAYIRVTKPEKKGHDITVELRDYSTATASKLIDPEVWGPQVDEASSKRAAKAGASILGPTAAKDAAKILGADRLSASQYKTLQKLLDASAYLQQRWKRDGNVVIRC